MEGLEKEKAMNEISKGKEVLKEGKNKGNDKQRMDCVLSEEKL